MSDLDRVRRANATLRELPETRAAFDVVRDDLIKQWSESAPGDAALREQLYFRLVAMGEVLDVLTSRSNDKPLADFVEKARG